jgi:hypothetical protein
VILGTGVPDDCRIDVGSRATQLRDLLFKEVQAKALHADTLRPLTARIRVLPAHSLGLVYEIGLECESVISSATWHRHIYALPDTVFRTERGPVMTSNLVDGDRFLPDYAEVSGIRRLFVQADFCRPVSASPVYVDVGGMYVLTCKR